MRRRAIRGMAVAGLVLGLLAGCGDDDSADAGDAPESGSTEPGEGEGATTTEGTLPPPFQDGTYFGYAISVDETGDRPMLDFDVARLLEGEEAEASQVEGCGFEDVGFCIDNTDETVRQVPLAPNVEVLDIQYGGDTCCEPQPSDLDQLLDPANTPQPPPVNVTIELGQVTKVEEVYFP